MGSAEAETDFLDQLYSAAVEPQLWTSVLTRFADIVDGTQAHLSIQDEVACEVQGVVARTDQAAWRLYAEHYVKCNPLLKTTDLPLALRVLTDEHKLAKQEFMRTEYYSDFLRRYDVHSLLIVRLALQHPNTAGVVVVRPARREPFGSADVAAAQRLHPHMIRAYRLATRIFGIDERRDGGDALLERSIHGIFVLDTNGLVRHVNRAGEALVGNGCALTVHGGILRTVSADATRILHALIAAACASDAERRGGSMMLARPTRRPLSITVAPILSERVSLFGAGRSVLVCVVDPEIEPAIPEQLLRDLFDLTPGEARVAAHLLRGCDPREAAKRLGVSYYTVRAHLVRIFDKTNTSRQSELVQLMTRTIGPLSVLNQFAAPTRFELPFQSRESQKDTLAVGTIRAVS